MAYTTLNERQPSIRLEPLDINESLALFEAQRCLYCIDAPCTQACPVCIDVPGFIKRAADQNWKGSSQILYQSNPIAAICGLVCPTDDLCEGSCVLPSLGQNPIRIGALQYYVSTKTPAPQIPCSEDIRRQIAVIGAGPSGIGCAVMLSQLGYRVVVFERGSKPGGLISQVIPQYRLPQAVIDHDLNRLGETGIEFRLGMDINSLRIQKILVEYDAVFIGIGLHGSRFLAVPGSDLPGVIQALDYLSDARQSGIKGRELSETGRRIVVVGGGNVALDAAVTAKMMGADRVKVVYRRSFAEMPAWKSEFLEASLLGVEFEWMSTVGEITGDNHVSGVMIEPMRYTGEEQDGRPWIEKDPEATQHAFKCDKVLLALGQRLEHKLVKELSLGVDPTGILLTHGDSFQTSNQKIFTAGDAAGTGSTVVEAVANGMAAGGAIHRWLAN